jgi:hypothetical protein
MKYCRGERILLQGFKSALEVKIKENILENLHSIETKNIHKYSQRNE